MGDASMRSPKDFKTSRSGRILFPRLKGWTGERIVIRKGGGVDLLDGGPDCTSTFESERSLFKARNGITMSQTFNMPTTVSQAQRIKISRSLSQSPSTEANLQRAIKRSKLKENQPVSKPTSSMKKTKRSPSPKKKLTKKSVSSSQESLERPSPKVLRTRVPCATSADPSKARTKSPEKTSANPSRGAPRERGVKSLPPTTVNNNRPSRSLVRNSESYVKPGPKCSKPRPPTESSSSRERPNPSGKQKLKRGSPTRSRRQRRNASPPPQDVDIFGPEFQPVVVLNRLRIRSEAALEMSTKTKINNTARNSKRKSPVLANKVVKKKKKVAATKSTSTTIRGRARTVKETKAIIEATSKAAADAVVEDEAEATAAFFKKDNAAFKRLTEATDILHDDFGESDDNLSIRTMRESSPMPSAVSPIGSLYGDSDADENGDDRFLGGSPTLKDRTSFQKAQLVHRVVKDRAKLMQQKTKKQKKRQMDIGDEEETAFPGGSNITPRVGELLKPQRMRALERDLKAKVGTRAFDFDTYYNGNLIHISVNSDSESEESSVDSLAD